MWAAAAAATKAFSSSRILLTSAQQQRCRGATVRSFTLASSQSNRTFLAVTVAAAAAAAATVILTTTSDSNTPLLVTSSIQTTQLEAAASVGVGQKEPATGIVFDALCNGYTLVGTGVRVKYGLIKVYAVGTYIDSSAVASIKHDSAAAIEAALLNVNVPRTIRIVMNRNLGIEKYTEAIVEALTPRMHGIDLDKLDEFKRLNPPIDLVKGTSTFREK
jgi:hypothetical protein